MHNCSGYTSVGDPRSATGIPKSEAPVLVDLTTQSAKKNGGSTACDSGCWDSALSYSLRLLRHSPFTALELSELKLWSVRPAKVLDCTVTVAAPT